MLGAAGYATYWFLGPGTGTQAGSAPAGNTQATGTPVAVPPSEPAATPAVPEPARTVNLSVSSVPSGARVYLDNRDLGLTPLRSFPVDAREDAQLRVEYTGRQPLKQSVSLTRGRNLRARLLPSGQGVSVLTDLAAPKPKPVAKPKPPL
ncbi:PEGA domain-containing protein [Deinococcus malanensis]|uniref:PEGA domain-containing protein n=1 Tax=Deinococcus malanensis TaxID=1706855 RepID=UPI003641C3AA